MAGVPDLLGGRSVGRKYGSDGWGGSVAQAPKQDGADAHGLVRHKGVQHLRTHA